MILGFKDTIYNLVTCELYISNQSKLTCFVINNANTNED